MSKSVAVMLVLVFLMASCIMVAKPALSSDEVAEEPESFPTSLVVAPIASVAIIGAGLVLYFAKIKKTSGKTK